MHKEIIKKIKSKKIKIGIVGLGYIGLPISLAFCKKKFEVIGFDKDNKRLNLLKKSISYIGTISNGFLKRFINKNFFVTSDFSKLKKVDIIIICVPTPINKDKTPDLNYIKSAVIEIKKNLRAGQTIISECTTYPGNTEEFLIPLFKKKRFKIGKNIFLGYSPEREDPGNKKFSILKNNIPKVVSGFSENCKEILKQVYNQISKKVYLVENIKTAEFTKLFENIYRSVNIGLVNEMKTVCKKLDINLIDAINAAKTKPFGFSPFYPGPGVGGHCIPVDPYYLSWRAKKFNIKTKFIKLAGEINDNRPKEVANNLISILKKKIKVKEKILILGLSYKKNSDDIRNSPPLQICEYLGKKTKYQIIVCDPLVKAGVYNQLQRFEFENVKNLKNKYFIKKFKAIIVMTDHDIFDYSLLHKNSKILIDCTNIYSNKKFKKVIKI